MCKFICSRSRNKGILREEPCTFRLNVNSVLEGIFMKIYMWDTTHIELQAVESLF